LVGVRLKNIADACVAEVAEAIRIVVDAALPPNDARQ
jgi:hypothetical protein